MFSPPRREEREEIRGVNKVSTSDFQHFTLLFLRGLGAFAVQKNAQMMVELSSQHVSTVSDVRSDRRLFANVRGELDNQTQARARKDEIPALRFAWPE